ncbi:MAG: hypothetical protein NTX42_00065 [Methanothrix sp.]|nr:hypothetical protein [Methanothrix sp.]
MKPVQVETCLIQGSFQPDTRPDRPPDPRARAGGPGPRAAGTSAARGEDVLVMGGRARCR